MNLKAILLVLCVFAITVSCKQSLPQRSIQNFAIRNLIDTSTVLQNSYSGVIVMDAETKKVLYQKDAEKYFTPASNTKLFTMYASLKYLGNELPALDYLETDTSLIFWGTGDPTFLHNTFGDKKVLNFLTSQPKQLYMATGDFTQKFYGPGWSWDDYNDAYQVENNALPIYGNIIEIKFDGKYIKTKPAIFQNSSFKISSEVEDITRVLSDNEFLLPNDGDSYEKNIPLKTSELMTQQLLIDTLKRDVFLLKMKKPENTKTITGVDKLPVIAKMIKDSDNFLAEQLLLMSSRAELGVFSKEAIIEKLNNTELLKLKNPLKWVDGSGLSRYNLMTPYAIADLLHKMRVEYGEDFLFPLLAQNGQAGTLSSVSSNEPTYIYGKSGSMSGVYNLGAFVKTKSGKTLIVSCMHNNFNGSVSTYRNWTAKLFEVIKDAY